MESPQKKKRIAVLVSDNGLWLWQADALHFAIKNSAAEIVAILLAPAKIKSEKLFIAKLWQISLKQYVKADEAFKSVNAISVEDIAAIKALNVDIIFCTDTSYGSELENYAAWGVWQFFFLTNNFLSEEIHAITSSEKNITLSLTSNRKIIRSGKFRVFKNSPAKALKLIYSEAETWIEYAIRLPLDSKKLIPSSVISIKTSTFFKQLHFIYNFLINYCRQRFRLLFTKEVWNVGVINKPISKSLEDDFTNHIDWLPNPINGIYADPFCFEHNGKLKILYEDLKFNKNHGVLSYVEFTSQKVFESNKTFLNVKEHLSYPYLFEADNKLYMLPECCEANQLKLYQINKEDFKIVDEIVLIDNIQAVDPSVVFYKNKWWLFCTLKNDSPDLKLHIYYCETLTGNWQPHLLNPVKIDVSSARPGGSLFINDNKLYRPSQDSSYSYGDRIVLNQIIELTENAFVEMEVKSISPKTFTQFNKGLHTLSGAGNFTLIDAKKVVLKLNVRFFRGIIRLFEIRRERVK